MILKKKLHLFLKKLTSVASFSVASVGEVDSWFSPRTKGRRWVSSSISGPLLRCSRFSEPRIPAPGALSPPRRWAPSWLKPPTTHNILFLCLFTFSLTPSHRTNFSSTSPLKVTTTKNNSNRPIICPHQLNINPATFGPIHHHHFSSLSLLFLFSPRVFFTHSQSFLSFSISTKSPSSISYHF